ncbi:cardiolipin synthase [Alkalicoccobacillus porphyridii]|uniref:Cardiolipin synthase n=1 Tax=Alkalicoccobacillus porphyridii TaxID=2597270 RepID=A0A553ZU08_9BACI|nr:cardiolipin synthase [Alkalicoccobacillus porphyridii]TSB44961.1 cardiolipin synthase [Alkalicoccobacillus porphyridii]
MKPLLISIAFIILVYIWFRIDYRMGMAKLRKEAHQKVQETRYPHASLIDNGEDFFVKLFHDIHHAHHHVHILFYIFKEDQIGTRLVDLLLARAKEGIDIILMVDWIGSKLSRKTIKTLREAGITFTYCHIPTFPTIFFSLNQRNHRKIAVIDGKIGYIGGFNAGDEYLGRSAKFGFWRDLHLRLEGDGVQDLQSQFLEDLEQTNADYFHKNQYYPKLTKGKHMVRLVPTNGRFLEQMLIETLQKARSSIYLGSPYYIPGPRVQETLLNAAQNGIDVKLILPQKSDHPLVKEGSLSYVERLVEAGASVYHYDQGFYHGKALVTDQSLAWVGTSNLDKRSFHLNNEMTCLLYDQESVQQVLDCLIHDMSISEALTVESLQNRSLFSKGKEQIALLLSNLL